MSRKGRTARGGEAGFTLMELLIVVAVVGILANIAVPASVYLLQRAQAQNIVTDFNAIQQAANHYYADRGSHIPEYAIAVVPTQLAPYMKSSMLWNNSKLRVRYDWENWLNASGQPTRPSTGVRIGFTVEVSDTRLLAMLQKVYKGPYTMTASNKMTMVIAPI